MSEDNRPPDGPDRSMADAAWSITSYLLSGMLVWGGVGWLVSRWTAYSLFFPVGVFVGLGAALYLIVIRFTK
jgi:ATP synthase protein I